MRPSATLTRHAPLRRKVELRSRNDRRLARLRAVQFGPHGDVIRRLPCAVCRRDFYARHDDETLTLILGFAHERGLPEMSDPHHATHTRGAGGRARELVPLCHGHHRSAGAIGRRTFAFLHEVDLPTLAARLARLSPALRREAA